MSKSNSKYSVLSVNLDPDQPSPMAREIRTLRHFMRETRAQMNDGALDYIKGAALLSRLSNSLTRLLLAEHRIAPRNHDVIAEFRRVMDAIIAINDQPPTQPHD